MFYLTNQSHSIVDICSDKYTVRRVERERNPYVSILHHNLSED